MYEFDLGSHGNFGSKNSNSIIWWKDNAIWLAQFLYFRLPISKTSSKKAALSVGKCLNELENVPVFSISVQTLDTFLSCAMLEINLSAKLAISVFSTFSQSAIYCIIVYMFQQDR